MRLTNPLANARGLGSAKEGFHHWWAQRLTAVALVPLCLWFVFSLASCVGANDHAKIIEWLQSPITATLMVLFLFALFYHAALGLQVVIEDYITCNFVKIGLIVGAKFLAAFAGLAAILAVVKVFLGL